jgi:hypothetical protein
MPGFVVLATYYILESLSLLAQASLRKDDTDNETILVEEDSNDEVRLPIIGGLELGIYLFFANGLQILGLEMVPAD